MPVYDSVVDTVGRTPLIHMGRLSAEAGVTLLGKMESRNPCGSVKDRVGVAMIRAAERAGVLEPGATIVEATSGNTGIALAYASAALGYRLIITMPETMSKERIALLRLFGAEVVLTRGALMGDAVTRAQEITQNTPGAVNLKQFENPANPEVHELTTAHEILADTEGRIDAFVAGVGTGGTVSGVGRILRKHVPSARVVAVEPAESAVLSGKQPGPHFIQGIGAGFVPDNLERDVIDEVVSVREDVCIAHVRRLARDEGILAGLSSGASLAAALELAGRPGWKNARIVFVLPDTGERYLSTLVDEMTG